ncbi:hypothetical protein CAter282_4063 [Collimonas arenae]|uniref:Transmembrane protein n=1 Tax=Collimonas arenae TaxID=279058 RepID=A0A127QNQ5_9BURK|nr:DUF3025 domain-containing protein [Collimonas arenae]AMP01830.1 hypothetical protein CAter10_4423 [Collimonas arenae]AMP11728.1 hypothetical protein CAter282_4063 [Collimonas arenae]
MDTPAAPHLPSFLAAIDWQQPWLKPFRTLGWQLTASADWRGALNALALARDIRNYLGLPIRFVEQAELPAATAYEAFIGSSGKVPTRDNLHDFLNALIWLSFPSIKAQLNALQAAELAKAGTLSGSSKPRGAARDAVTIFDENAALLLVRDNAAGQALIAVLRNHLWQEAFLEQRDMFGGDAEVWLFGHALLEKLVRPYKAITAHTLVISVPAHVFSLTEDARRIWIDQHVAADLEQQGAPVRRLTPLPVLGVPGWACVQDSDFYADATVFRPKRAG